MEMPMTTIIPDNFHPVTPSNAYLVGNRDVLGLPFLRRVPNHDPVLDSTVQRNEAILPFSLITRV